MLRDKEHTPMIHVCADRSTSVIENLCSSVQIFPKTSYAVAHIHTYPMNFKGMTGLPCHVVAEITQQGDSFPINIWRSRFLFIIL